MHTETHTHTLTLGMSVTRKMTNERDARTNNRKIMSWLRRRRRRRLNSFEFRSYFFSRRYAMSLYLCTHTLSHTSVSIYFLCC